MVNINDFTFSYNKSQPVLDHLSFDIDENHFIAILGNNGAGKSTLLKCMNGIQKVSEGTIYISGEDVLSMHRNEIAKRIAYVAQKNRSTRMTVFDSVLLGRKPYIKWDATKEDLSLVDSLLQRMHLEKIKLRYLDELSGGELQKVMLARALAQEPKLLLLDEPTSNLDPKNQHEVLSTLKKIAKTNHIALAIVIHDLNLALRYCDRFLFMKDQKIYSYGDAHTMTPTCIKDVYGINATIQEYQGIKIVIPLPENDSLT